METAPVLERTRTTELVGAVGERVRLTGWLHALRRLGGVTFVILRDGWGMAQVVSENEAELAPLTEADAGPESVVAVEGLSLIHI